MATMDMPKWMGKPTKPQPNIKNYRLPRKAIVKNTHTHTHMHSIIISEKRGHSFKGEWGGFYEMV